MECRQCKRDFPAHLINEMAIAKRGEALRHIMVCPPCALDAMNEAHGTKATRFQGPRAQAMLEEAQTHLAKQAGEGKG
jgi:hypothetical protein